MNYIQPIRKNQYSLEHIKNIETEDKIFSLIQSINDLSLVRQKIINQNDISKINDNNYLEYNKKQIIENIDELNKLLH